MNVLFKSRTEKIVGNVNITIKLLPDGGCRQYGIVQCLNEFNTRYV